MNGVINQLVLSLTGKEDIWECTTEELQLLVNQYPYFGVANFLLAKKQETESSSVSIDYNSKAALYFQQPLWLDHLIHETGTKLPDLEPTERLEREQEQVAELEHKYSNEFSNESAAKEALQVVVSNDQNKPADNWASNSSDERAEPVETRTPSDEFRTDDVVASAVNQDVIYKSEKPLDIPIAKEDNQVISTALESIEQAPANPYDHEDEEPLPDSVNEPELKLPEFKIEPIDPSKATLSFEPYHTVDYFASQGIRFKEEDKSKDKLTKQLKSFTEWLKVMKKLPESEIQSSVSASEEHRVAILAQVSLSDREVVTEAMAEVWELQGKRDKAAQIYQKLSLLDPAKSAYFAAKIDHLKRL